MKTHALIQIKYFLFDPGGNILRHIAKYTRAIVQNLVEQPSLVDLQHLSMICVLLKSPNNELWQGHYLIKCQYIISFVA